MPAPYRLTIRLVVALMAVAVFAVAYLIALVLEAPNVPAAAARVSHAADP